MSKRGRPSLSDEDLEKVVRKLSPYLRAGLSVRKACLEAGIPKSTVYDHMKSNSDFSDKIARHQQFLSVLTAQTFLQHFTKIVRKVNPINNEESKGLNDEDIRFLQWFATHSKTTREEFGDRREYEIVDPEAEINRIAGIIDRATS